jgi:hypothetical protein
MKNNDNTKKLKELKKTIANTIKEYNKLASKEKFDSRIALVTAEASFEDTITEQEKFYDLQARPDNIDKHFKENGPYESPVYYHVEDNTGWFPSSICIGY